MLGIDGSEFLVILLIFVIVVGPKDLPKMLKVIAKAFTYVRSTANEFRHHFDDAMKQAELDDLKKILSDTGDFNFRKDLEAAYDSIYDEKKGVSDNSDFNTTPHKKGKDIQIFEFDTSEINEDLTVSTSNSHEIIYTSSKNKGNTS
ncbi:Sec-independent protein translocase protein TatB [Bartonella sp. JB15]|uniref:Sec-independent protein translocase protein TatB n=1 Tax=Bartonella sp. JB15 TaxID=1933906 RepID=UPI00099ADDA8|nr:Sec-independent protein translocase protein TatB [Bartonella sp. JB15]AQX28290.1 sec-independent protein translocase protein TatB [Bartonella sp. JB15]